MRNPKASRAFTLVELLVVIGIIGLLVALLIPSLQMARRAARTAGCLSNMHTMADAAANYEAQYKGALALNMVALLPDHTGAPGHSNELDPRFTFCPALLDYITDTTMYNSYTSITYSWNNWLVDINANIAPALFHPSSIKNGSEVALMADTLSVGANGLLQLFNNPGLHDPFWEGSPSQPAKPAPVPALCAPVFHGRHGGNGVVLWLDGHASPVRAIPVPIGTPVTHAYGGLQQTPQFYNHLHLGYLARSANDLNSITAIYDFVSNENALSQNNINAFFKLYNNNGYTFYSVDPAAY